MSEPTAYEICIGEVLDEKWTAYFAPFELTTEIETTILRGPVHDQAELFGVLLRICNLGLHLVSVNPMTPICDGRSVIP